MQNWNNKIKGSCLFDFFPRLRLEFFRTERLGRRKGGVALNKVNNADLRTANLALNWTTEEKQNTMKILQLPSFLIHCLFLTSQGKQIRYSLQVDRKTKIKWSEFRTNKKQKRINSGPQIWWKVRNSFVLIKVRFWQMLSHSSAIFQYIWNQKRIWNGSQ